MIAFTLLIITLQSCESSSTNSNDEIQTKSFIIFGNTQAFKSDVKLNGNTLLLGDIEIKNWPLTDFTCSTCDISLDRRFHPNGPTTWIRAIDSNETKTWIMTSYQKQFSADQWEIRHIKDQIIFTNSKSKKMTTFNSHFQSPVSIKSNENCTLLWAKKEFLDQPQQHLSPDVAQFKSQFIIQCDI
jgi:hypothetical protein